MNDPEHPAIREFILKVKALLDTAGEQKSVQADVTALMLIQLQLMTLENTLRNG